MLNVLNINANKPLLSLLIIKCRGELAITLVIMLVLLLNMVNVFVNMLD